MLIWLIILIICICSCIYSYNLLNEQCEKNIQKDKFFYEIEEINTQLNNIKHYNDEIKNEVLKINCENEHWKDWPERYLYDNNKNATWKVYPFYAFGIWIEKNCKECPTIYNFIKQIPNVKLATLSKLSPKIKLKPHQGWSKHSNYVIRCHYGIIVPDNCYVIVKENNKTETRQHKQFEWLIFDDAKEHSAENNSDFERIVLIIDIERPPNIKIGKSEIDDTKELTEIINAFSLSN